MCDALKDQLCSKLCQHNTCTPRGRAEEQEKVGETGNEFTVPQCCYGYLLKGKGCGPGLSDGKVSPQGGSVRAGVRLCGVGRVMVSDRCWFSVRVRTRS